MVTVIVKMANVYLKLRVVSQRVVKTCTRVKAVRGYYSSLAQGHQHNALENKWMYLLLLPLAYGQTGSVHCRRGVYRQAAELGRPTLVVTLPLSTRCEFHSLLNKTDNFTCALYFQTNCIPQHSGEIPVII